MATPDLFPSMLLAPMKHYPQHHCNDNWKGKRIYLTILIHVSLFVFGILKNSKNSLCVTRNPLTQCMQNNNFSLQFDMSVCLSHITEYCSWKKLFLMLALLSQVIWFAIIWIISFWMLWLINLFCFHFI